MQPRDLNNANRTGSKKTEFEYWGRFRKFLGYTCWINTVKKNADNCTV